MMSLDCPFDCCVFALFLCLALIDSVTVNWTTPPSSKTVFSICVCTKAMPPPYATAYQLSAPRVKRQELQWRVGELMSFVVRDMHTHKSKIEHYTVHPSIHLKVTSSWFCSELRLYTYLATPQWGQVFEGVAFGHWALQLLIGIAPMHP